MQAITFGGSWKMDAGGVMDSALTGAIRDGRTKVRLKPY